MFSQVVDEPASSTPSLHSLAERGIELDQTVEEESGDWLMLKTAGREERMSDGCGVTFRKKFPYTIFVTQRGENIERARQNALARKKLQYSLGAGPDCALPYLWIYCSARIQDKLGALDARERLFPERFAAVTERAGGKAEDRFSGITAPRQKRGILLKQLAQPFDVVVVDSALRFRDRPLQA